MRWSLLIEPLGHKPGIWNTYNALLFGYLTNYALPRMGEVTRCIALNKKEKIPLDSLIGTVIVERAIDLISLLLIIIFLLIARFEKFGFFFREQIFNNLNTRSTGLLGDNFLLILILFIILLTMIASLFIFRNSLNNYKVFKKLFGFLSKLLSGLKTILHMKKKWLFLFHTVFIWTNYALMTWVVVFALPEITGDFKFADGVFLLVIGSLGMAAPVQAGIGAFHWIVAKGLETVYSIGQTEGLSFATLQHTSQTFLVFLLGSIATLFLFTKIGEKKDPEKINNVDIT